MSKRRPKPSRRDEDATDLYRLVVDTARDYAIFMLDRTGHVLTWNSGANRIKGYAPDEIIGKHFSVFYPPEDLAAGKPDWELRVAVEVGRVEDEGWRVRKDGSRFWANVVITALHDDSGQLVGFSKVTRDLTERKEAQERAVSDARRVAEAEAGVIAKGEFLASMSHELRTPLNAIGGYAELLALGIGGEVTAQQRDYIERIRRSQQHLLGIINDLLNFTRLEAGHVTYDVSHLVLAEAVTNVLPMIEPQALTRRLALRIDLGLQAGEPVSALADRAKVEQIVLNLLSNAVKFTASGGTVTIGVFREADRSGVRVSDTGIGIPPDKINSVFEPFVQVGRSLISPHEGTGLGLAISRDLARAMGGELTVRSEPGRGSTFELSFPVAA